MIVSAAFAGKRYAVLGLARSGLSTVETLLASGAEVMAWDRQAEPRERLEGRVMLADPLEADLTGMDGIVVSPGVPLNTHPIAARAEQFGVPVIGDVELFALARPDLPPHRVIGVTGTNGKSTTVALIDHLMKSARLPSLMAGNIGLPILSREPLPEGGVYVLELSSYQLDLTRSLACDVAVLTNVTPDHLDRYDGFEAYAFSKSRLFAMQERQQFAAFGCGDATTRALKDAAAQRRDADRVTCADRDALAEDAANWPALQGPHNRENAALAIAAAREIGLDDDAILTGLRSFAGLPHRMEVLGAVNGVTWVNDSKATNPASAAPALAAFEPDPQPRIHWIAGGLPKGEGLAECEGELDHVARAYTIGEAGSQFARALEGTVPVEECELLCEAVRRAALNAQPGDVVLLSPACASFDQFRDYEARGDTFRRLVEQLAEAGGDAGEIDCGGAAA